MGRHSSKLYGSLWRAIRFGRLQVWLFAYVVYFCFGPTICFFVDESVCTHFCEHGVYAHRASAACSEFCEVVLHEFRE